MADLTERERRLAVTLVFDVYGTEDQARATTERLRHILSVELSREVKLAGLEMTAHGGDTGEPTVDDLTTREQSTDSGAADAARADPGNGDG